MEWIPANTPPDAEYWQALLQDGEHGPAAPPCFPDIPWEAWLTEPSDESGATWEQADAATEEHRSPWDLARQALESGQIIQAVVTGCNRGGAIVTWHGLEGFVPASHIVSLPPASDGQERRAGLHRLIGTALSLRIIELDPDEEQLVLSERASLLQKGTGGNRVMEIHPGDIIHGRITDLCSFGAFVDVGGLEGLLHISEISWSHVHHPGDLLSPGRVLKLYVLDVDRERRRIRLSLKRLQPDPWRSVEERYRVGQVVEGTVTQVAKFGAFVRIEEGLEGLIHISRLPSGRSAPSRKPIQAGDRVTVRIIQVDGQRRRMRLSWEPTEAQHVQT